MFCCEGSEMRQSKNRCVWLWCVGLWVGVLACGQAEESGVQVRAVESFPVPRDAMGTRSVQCVLPDQSKTRMFREGWLRGAAREYYSSKEIDYSRTDWPRQKGFSWTALDGLLGSPASLLSAVVVDVRNVGGVPHYHYYGNGTQHTKGQNWSSTKVLAAFAALHRMRLLSEGLVGASSMISDDLLGRYPFGHHIHALHESSSNTSGGLFKHLAGLGAPDGGSLNATSFVRGWLSLPTEEFNGYYGDRGFDPYYRIPRLDGGASVELDTSAMHITPNHLTPLAMAEFWKRIGVNYRDIRLLPQGRKQGAEVESYGYRAEGAALGNSYRSAQHHTWLPTVQTEDLLMMFYGDTDQESKKIGGMMYDLGIRSVFTEALPTQQQLDGWTQGRWRIYGKIGAGDGDWAYGGYVCLPHFKGGREFSFFVLGKGEYGGQRAYLALQRLFSIFATGLHTETPAPSALPIEPHGAVLRCRSLPEHGHGPFAYRIEQRTQGAFLVVQNAQTLRVVAELPAKHTEAGRLMILGGRQVRVFFDARSGTGNGVYLYRRDGMTYIAHDNVDKAIPAMCY